MRQNNKLEQTIDSGGSGRMGCKAGKILLSPEQQRHANRWASTDSHEPNEYISYNYKFIDFKLVA